MKKAEALSTEKEQLEKELADLKADLEAKQKKWYQFWKKKN